MLKKKIKATEGIFKMFQEKKKKSTFKMLGENKDDFNENSQL